MNIYETLKKLRFIKPDVDYSSRSRNIIVTMRPDILRPRVTLWQFVMQNVQLGSTIALTGLLLVLGFGGFSVWKSFSPFGINSLDPTNLRAEADAIRDMEVALQSVQYIQSANPETPKLSLKDVQPKSAPTENDQAPDAAGLSALSAPASQSRIAESPDQATSTEAEAAASSAPIEQDFSTTTVDSVLDLLIEQ